jgi:hypothetical protein
MSHLNITVSDVRRIAIKVFAKYKVIISSDKYRLSPPAAILLRELVFR